MAQKITDNMKAIPIKNYDFQVDFKVEEKDVMETFLDPTENKHISILKRPSTAKTSTWGTPKVPAKKFATVQASEMDLAIKGTANPVSEGALSDNPLPSNLFKFKSHLPSKKISENPKLALSMFRKKTISNKSGKTIQGNDPFSYTAGPEGFSQTGNLQRPQTAMTSQGIQGGTAIMVGLPSGKKLTAKGAAQLKETKVTNALKSSGAAHGLFGKMASDTDVKKDMTQRPKSAIVSSAVGFMQELKKTKKLKPPKKPDFGLDEDEEMEPAPEFSDKENSLANTRSRLDEEDKPKVRKMAPMKKEPAKKKFTEEYEEKVENVENNENEDNEEAEQEEVDERDPYEKMAKKISMVKKANKAKVEEEQEAEDDVQEFPSEEEKEEEGEEHAEIDEDLFGNGEDYGATESMPSGIPKGKKKGASERYQENEEEEQVNEIPSYGDENLGNENENEDEDNGENADAENNEENNEENTEENNEENENQEEEQEQKNLEEEMRQSVGAASDTSSSKKFRSNMANELNELQANLVSGQEDLLSTYGGNSKGLSVTGKAKPPVAPKKETVERKEKTEFDKAKNQFIKDAKKQAGGFVPYKYLNDLDGDKVQQQRDQVTDEITNYLRAADQKRQRKLEELDKTKTRDREPKETNEYSSRLESLNARLKGSLQGVKNILSTSKAITSSQNRMMEVQDIDSSPEDQE